MSFEFKAKRFVKGMGEVPEIQHFIWMGYFDEEAKKRLFSKDIQGQIENESLDLVRATLQDLPEENLLDRIMHLDVIFFLEGNGLFQADRMTMAASVEGRVPILNMRLLEYVNDLPIELKMPRTKTKALFRKALKKYLPAKIINKPKKGFGPPTAAWLRGPLASTLQSIFSLDKIKSAGIFNPDEIARYITEHMQKKADHGRLLWSLLSFQLWYDKYILKQSSS